MNLPEAIIQTEADQAGLDPDLVAAFCLTESSGNPAATRYEPAYHYLVNPAGWAMHLGIDVDDETRQQMTSWGLMQIMGAVARGMGFGGPIPSLVQPGLNIHYGCMLLKRLHTRYPNRIEDVIASYNAGSPRIGADGKYENQAYVDSVLKNWKGKP